MQLRLIWTNPTPPPPGRCPYRFCRLLGRRPDGVILLAQVLADPWPMGLPVRPMSPRRRDASYERLLALMRQLRQHSAEERVQAHDPEAGASGD